VVINPKVNLGGFCRTSGITYFPLKDLNGRWTVTMALVGSRIVSLKPKSKRTVTMTRDRPIEESLTYKNKKGAVGLLHSILVKEGPNPPTMTFTLSLVLEGIVAMEQDANGIQFLTKNGLAFIYKDLKVTDATGRVLPSKMKPNFDKKTIGLETLNGPKCQYPILIA